MYPGNKEKQDETWKVIHRKARDHARTPVQWNDGPNAGFSTGKPWMRVIEDYKTVNAEVQQSNQDPNKLSVFQFWKRAIDNRKKHKEAFVYGDFEALDMDHPKVFAYVRSSPTDGSWIVVLNFTRDEVEWQLPAKVILPFGPC